MLKFERNNKLLQKLSNNAYAYVIRVEALNVYRGLMEIAHN